MYETRMLKGSCYGRPGHMYETRMLKGSCYGRPGYMYEWEVWEHTRL